MKEFDFVVTDKPINKTASMVLQKGEHYNYFDLEPHTFCSSFPVETKLFKGPKEYDLTNKRFGRLLVVGYVGKHKKVGARWLCKCDCGNYVIHYYKPLSNKSIMQCKACYHVEHARKFK